jgi:hypothetical protein
VALHEAINVDAPYLDSSINPTRRKKFRFQQVSNPTRFSAHVLGGSFDAHQFGPPLI